MINFKLKAFLRNLMYVCYILTKNILAMKKIFALLLISGLSAYGQFQNKDGNRIGISGGISQTSLFTNNFSAKPESGFAGGLSVRGNYYNDWSMIYGMQFFSNNFSLEADYNQRVKYNFQGVKVRLLLSYNVIEDHVSVDFGPQVQINGKMHISGADEQKQLAGTVLKAKDIIDVSPASGQIYVGASGGGKVIRALVFYEYGFTNFFNKLNKDDDLLAKNGNRNFKGTLGTINAQVIFNL